MKNKTIELTIDEASMLDLIRGATMMTEKDGIKIILKPNWKQEDEEKKET